MHVGVVYLSHPTHSALRLRRCNNVFVCLCACVCACALTMRCHRRQQILETNAADVNVTAIVVGAAQTCVPLFTVKSACWQTRSCMCLLERPLATCLHRSLFCFTHSCSGRPLRSKLRVSAIMEMLAQFFCPFKKTTFTIQPSGNNLWGGRGGEGGAKWEQAYCKCLPLHLACL